MGVTALGAAARKLRDGCGQATVEFAVALPVLIAVAVIAVNALLFFSECAAFDRAFRGAVRVFATSPAYGQGSSDACAGIVAALEETFPDDNLDVSVEAEDGGFGHVTYRGTISFTPTLFGLGLKSEVFGVALPRLEHSATLTVDPYKPGVIA